MPIGRFAARVQHLPALLDQPCKRKWRRAHELKRHIHAPIVAHCLIARHQRDGRLGPPRHFRPFDNRKAGIGGVDAVNGQQFAGNGCDVVRAVIRRNTRQKRKQQRIGIPQDAAYRVARVGVEDEKEGVVGAQGVVAWQGEADDFVGATHHNGACVECASRSNAAFFDGNDKRDRLALAALARGPDCYDPLNCAVYLKRPEADERQVPGSVQADGRVGIRPRVRGARRARYLQRQRIPGAHSGVGQGKHLGARQHRDVEGLHREGTRLWRDGEDRRLLLYGCPLGGKGYGPRAGRVFEADVDVGIGPQILRCIAEEGDVNRFAVAHRDVGRIVHAGA